jgi:hypothetical protein
LNKIAAGDAAREGADSCHCTAEGVFVASEGIFGNQSKYFRFFSKRQRCNQNETKPQNIGIK